MLLFCKDDDDDGEGVLVSRGEIDILFSLEFLQAAARDAKVPGDSFNVVRFPICTGEGSSKV